MSDQNSGVGVVDAFYLPDKGMVLLEKADPETLRRIIREQQEAINDLNVFLAEGSDDDPSMIKAAKQQTKEIHALRAAFLHALRVGAIGQDAFSGFKVGVELMNSIRRETAENMLKELKGREDYEAGKTDENPAVLVVNTPRNWVTTTAKWFQIAATGIVVLTVAQILGNLLVKWFSR